MIINTIKKIVDALLSPSDQHLQGMQNIIDEAHWEYGQGQFFEQLAIEHHQAFQNNTTNTMLRDDQSIYDNRNAMWYYLRAALRGDKEAQYKLGFCYLNGQLGLDRSYIHAEEWLKKAAHQGHLEAKEELQKAFNTLAFS